MTLGKVSDSKILELKERGMSLRQIASALGISHEAVRKRLKAVKDKDQVSTNPGDQRFTAAPTKNKKLSTGSNAHESKVSRQPRRTVNRVSTEKTACPTITESVNPLKTLAEQPTESKKGVSQEGCSEIDDLFGAIKDFLESKGIEVYRMQVAPEAYQVERNGQIVRFYVQRSHEHSGVRTAFYFEGKEVRRWIGRNGLKGKARRR